jgi:hypothetical protein
LVSLVTSASGFVFAVLFAVLAIANEYDEDCQEKRRREPCVPRTQRSA